MTVAKALLLKIYRGQNMKYNLMKRPNLWNGLSKSPLFIKLYFGGSLIGLILSITLIILRFGFLVYTVDPYYLICVVIISGTLLAMAIVSIKEDGEENKDGGI